jgi:hypothetical protein
MLHKGIQLTYAINVTEGINVRVYISAWEVLRWYVTFPDVYRILCVLCDPKNTGRNHIPGLNVYLVIPCLRLMICELEATVVIAVHVNSAYKPVQLQRGGRSL